MFIRQISIQEASQLKDFPPENWYFNFEKFIETHYGQEYFYACVAVEDDRIIGSGNAVISGAVAWLSNIIVIPEYQRQGVGTAITRYLKDYLVKQNCRTLLLIATAEGRRVYKSVGFKPLCDYYYFRSGDQSREFTIADQIRKASPQDYPAILHLDELTTAEDRSCLLNRYVDTAWVYDREKEIRGYYIPEFGRGLIIALDPEAGISLLKFKHHLTDRKTAFPQQNEHALKFFNNYKFENYHNCTRMYWGEMLPWIPQNIYSYAHGCWG
ncbi:MAG: GNAT family N-acetyltransferase [bacterium]